VTQPRAARSLYNRCAHVCPAALPPLVGLFAHMVDNGGGRGHLLWRLGFDHCAPPQSPAIAPRGQRPGRGPWGAPIPWGSPGCQSRWRRQARRGQGGATRWGWWRVRVGQPPQGCRGLGRRVCPGCATAAGRWRPETPEPRASLGKAHRHGRTAPPEESGGSQRGAPTIWQGHLRLHGTPWRPRHCGGRQASSGARRRT
jgi:hypothetical protein